MSALRVGALWSECGQVAQCPHFGREDPGATGDRWLNVPTWAGIDWIPDGSMSALSRPPRLGVNRCAQCLSAHSTGLKTLGWVCMERSVVLGSSKKFGNLRTHEE